jgi:hypothetical protein
MKVTDFDLGVEEVKRGEENVKEEKPASQTRMKEQLCAYAEAEVKR